MSKHTPGPWSVSTSMPTRVVVSSNGHTFPIANCSNSGWSTEIAEGNARLTAAAPDMLNALRLSATVFEILLEPLTIATTSVAHAFTQTVETQAKVRAAIALAIGTGDGA